MEAPKFRRAWSNHAQDRLASIRKLKEAVKGVECAVENHPRPNDKESLPTLSEIRSALQETHQKK